MGCLAGGVPGRRGVVAGVAGMNAVEGVAERTAAAVAADTVGAVRWVPGRGVRIRVRARGSLILGRLALVTPGSEPDRPDGA